MSKKKLILIMAGALFFGLSSTSVSATGESASLSSSGVNFEITPTSANPNGTVAIGTDNLTVSSTCSSGYKLYISTTSNEEGSNTLENVDIEDSSSTTAPTSIPITSGTISSPTLLNAASSKNHWGFAMASGDTGIASTGFDASTNATVTNNSLFASIPLLDNMSTIRQKTSSADNETVNVYYGVNVGTDLAPGSYSSTVMYTMVMPSPCDYTLMFEDGIEDTDPIESEVTKMPESTNIGRNTSVNLGDYVNEFSREGYSITGWKNLIDNLTYGKDDTVNINTTNVDIIKLAPIWTLNTYTITLNSGTGITNTTITVTKDTSTVTNKTGTTTTDTNPTVTVGYKSTIQIGYAISNGYHFNEWEITSVDTDSDGNPLITKDDLTLLSGTDATNNSIYSFTVPTSSVTLTAKAEGNKYTVHFNSNGGSGTMNDIQMTYGSPATLPENTFTNGDYEFYGWSKTKQDPSTDPTRDYTDGQTGVFNLTTSNPSGTGSATLYAVWKDAVQIMQNWDGCTGLTVTTSENYEDDKTYARLLDTRNNVIYKVRRYSDGACWMAEDLALTPGDALPTENVTSGNRTLTTSDSQGAGTINYVSSFGYSATATRARYDVSNVSPSTNLGYYSWSSANLVCPAGWTLPTQAQWSSFLSFEGITDNEAGYEKIVSMPYNFNFTGMYYPSGFTNPQGGYYWTATAHGSDTSQAYYMRLYDTSVQAADPYYKYSNFAVRCVQDYSTTMQGYTDTQCAKLSNHSSVTLIDLRNNVRYTATKMADGLCWMTTNLRLTPGISDPGSTAVSSGTLTIDESNSSGSGELYSPITGLMRK